ncbi:MAG: sigma-54-dependent Fis family transcriptional regulator [Deltaproteobacteria bacterium]|nr:sigma-54-dependent Fis family transcriptional regulator [Candidatus Anaeroferrophillacea bacterium]
MHQSGCRLTPHLQETQSHHDCRLRYLRPALFVDDDPRILSALKRPFFDDHFTIHTAPDGRQAMDILARHRVDLAISDLRMPEMDGLELLQHISNDFPATRVMMLTAFGRIQDVVTAMNAGAVDFIEKPFEQDILRQKVYHLRNLRQQNRQLPAAPPPFRLQQQESSLRLLGVSAAMLQLKQLLIKVAQSDAPVLIQGETVTGKELVAQAIHEQNGRANQPFIPVDCGTLNEQVMDSELFGHRRGAFTGAHTDRPGLFRSADGGTIFFDEIGELPLSMQVKLLRTIQERQVRPVGSQKFYPIDVRIIAHQPRPDAGGH